MDKRPTTNDAGASRPEPVPPDPLAVKSVIVLPLTGGTGCIATGLLVIVWFMRSRTPHTIRPQRFEKAFHRADGPAHWANAKIVRSADDFVILARWMSP